MMRLRTGAYRVSQGSIQPGPSFPCLNHFKVERWASVLSESDSEYCSPQLPWQLGKIRKPEEEKLLFHWAGPSPAQNSYHVHACPCGGGAGGDPRWGRGTFSFGSPAALTRGKRWLVGDRPPQDGGVQAKAGGAYRGRVSLGSGRGGQTTPPILSSSAGV